MEDARAGYVSPTETRYDPAEEAVLGLGRTDRRSLEACAGAHFTAQLSKRDISPPRTLASPTAFEDLRAPPIPTRARPTYLDAVQLHARASPAICGGLVDVGPRPASPGESAPAVQDSPPFSASTKAPPRWGDGINGIHELGSFKSSTPTLLAAASASPDLNASGSMLSDVSMKAAARRSRSPNSTVHGYKKPLTYHERLARERRRYMTEEYARRRAFREEQAELARQQSEREEAELARQKAEFARLKEEGRRKLEEAEAAELLRLEQLHAEKAARAVLNVQRMLRGYLYRREHNIKLNNPVVLIALLGGMGVGKTTMCNHLLSLGEQPEMKDSGISFCHLSSGRLLRQAVARKSHKEWLGIQVAMDDGQPVPDQIVIEVILAEITRFRFRAHGSVTKPVCLLDNFPANKLQTDLLRERVGPLRGAFLCECSEETMLSRVEARAEEAERQEGPKSTPERRDNNAETALRSVRSLFEGRVKPLVDQFESEGLLKRLDCNGSLEESCAKVAEAVVELLV